MAKSKKSSKTSNFLDELEDTIKEDKQNVYLVPTVHKIPKEEFTEVSEEDIITEELTYIDPELVKYEKQIREIDIVLDSINPLTIDDTEERLKALKLKMEILVKKEPLMDALNRLREKDKLKTDQIKGNKNISPLEDGSLD